MEISWNHRLEREATATVQIVMRAARLKVCQIMSLAAVALLISGVFAIPQAHFRLNLNVRIFHVEHLADGLRVYVRTPMPFLVAGRVGPIVYGDLPEPAPFTSNRIEQGKVAHYVDWVQFDVDRKGLGALAEDGLHLSSRGARMRAEVEDTRIHRVGTAPGFATLEEVKSVFAGPISTTPENAPLYVGDAAVDIALRYRASAPIYEYQVSSSLDPGLPGQGETANLILDHTASGVEVFRDRGLLTEPVKISHSAVSAFGTFIKEGVRHILEGWDHVLYVICLVLGSNNLRSLFWRVSGFTIGHSVTLALGLFGFVPSGAWFIPAVETGIALSILYVAGVAIVGGPTHVNSERNLFGVNCALGLLHGLGFSFVLQKILQITSPDIWQSLLAFNIGVEIGQILIILVAWPLFKLIERLDERAWSLSRLGLASACAVVALVWTGQRALSVIETL
ncbi:MAG: HupE/UreJ family protein [Hyphomicrobiaceae bacterium]